MFLERVEPGATAAIRVKPQVDFTGKRLCVLTPEDFEVCDLKVNGKSQMAGSTALPAAAFGIDQSGIPLSMDECRVRMEIELTVRSSTKESRLFRAVLFGTGKIRMYDWSESGSPRSPWAFDEAARQLQDSPCTGRADR